MNGGSRIIALGGGQVDDTVADGAERPALSAQDHITDDPAMGDDAQTDRWDVPRGRSRWIVPAVAALLIVGWTVLFAVAKAGALRTATNVDVLVGLVSIWALPVTLVLIGVLIARTTLRDASRHAAVIHALAHESRQLDMRLRAMNTELSLARDFIAAQSRDLESLGRVAVDRLSGSADRLKDLIAGQGQDIDHIGVVAGKALDNIAMLRAHLPVISNSAKDAANAIALAGQTADNHVESLITGFNRLNEFGTASARKVEEVRVAVDAALDGFAGVTERIGLAGEMRLRAVTDALAAQRDAIERDEATALAAMRARADALDATTQGLAARLADLDAAIGQRRAAMAAAAAQSADAIDTRLGQIDSAIEAQRARQLAAIEHLARICEGLSQQVATFATTIDSSAQTGSRVAGVVDTALATLTDRLNDATGALGGTDQALVDLTDAAVRLLELIEAANDGARNRIPEALHYAIAGIDGFEARVTLLRDSLVEAGQAGKALNGVIGQTDNGLRGLRAEIATITEEMLARTHDQETRLGALRDMLRTAQTDSDRLAGSIERRLAGAIAELEAAAHKAGSDLGEGTAAQISALAARFGEETGAALASVAQGHGAQLIAQLEGAMDTASQATRDTARLMRDQLARIDELAGNLEARVNHVRERAEEQVDSDFARRTALITESLNSTAIDIARILSTEVSETAWTAYLRGERGIFTRRAVSLLDNGDVRVVQQHYETDDEFRTHVNRYIHDFEAMLRQLLSTRDGNALGVTLLSSDMGKLYVALAQGIERLRT